MPKNSEYVLVASNRKAKYDYHILDIYEAGMVLWGTEVKALRAGRVSLLDGFASISSREVWLENVHIPEYFQGTWTNHAPRRKRKLLLHRKEILKLSSKVRESGLALIPTKIYFTGGKAKVEIALSRGKKEYDKRQTLREKQDSREAQRAMRSRSNR